MHLLESSWNCLRDTNRRHADEIQLKTRSIPILILRVSTSKIRNESQIYKDPQILLCLTILKEFTILDTFFILSNA